MMSGLHAFARATVEAAHAAPAGVHDVRCECGKLIARLSLRGLEIKCSRCKRFVVLDWVELLQSTLRGALP